MAAAKKQTAAAKKASTTAKPRATAPRKSAKTIRNLRGTVVHARFYSVSPKDPYRLALNPRGQSGDTSVVPVALQDDPTFLAGIDVLWEIITATEAKALQGGYAPVGYLGRSDAPQIIRTEDTTITSAPDWDGKGRLPVDREVKRTTQGKQLSERGEFGTGMHTVDVPGSDAALHAGLKAGQEALPDGVDISSRRVVVERVKGA
jgi:hypothetical protein